MLQRSVTLPGKRRLTTSSAFQDTNSTFFSKNNHYRQRSITQKEEPPQTMLTDETIQTITKQALKDLKNTRHSNIEIIDCIKGKPYCLRLGEKEPTTDNFKTFYNRFYSTIYKDNGRASKIPTKQSRKAKENFPSLAYRKQLQTTPSGKSNLKAKFSKNLNDIIKDCDKVMSTDPCFAANLFALNQLQINTKIRRVN